MAHEPDNSERQGSAGVPESSALANRREERLRLAAEYLVDPFSDTTRERQKYLLLSSVLTLCLAQTIISFSEVETEIGKAHIESFKIVYVFVAASAYLMTLFAVSALQELTSATYKFETLLTEQMESAEQDLRYLGATKTRLETIREKFSAYKEEWAPTELEHKLVVAEIEEKRRPVREKLETASAKLNAAANSLKAAASTADQQALSDEIHSLREVMDELDLELENIGQERSERLAEIRERQKMISEKHEIKDVTGELDALIPASDRYLENKNYDTHIRLAGESVRYLKLRISVEIVLPLIFGTTSILVALRPAFRWIYLHL